MLKDVEFRDSQGGVPGAHGGGVDRVKAQRLKVVACEWHKGRPASAPPPPPTDRNASASGMYSLEIPFSYCPGIYCTRNIYKVAKVAILRWKYFQCGNKYKN